MELTQQCKGRPEKHAEIANTCRIVNGLMSYALFVLAVLTSAPVVTYIWQHDTKSKTWGLVALICTLVVAAQNGSLARANYVQLQYEQQEAASFFGNFKQDVAIRLSALPATPFEALQLYMKQLSDSTLSICLLGKIAAGLRSMVRGLPASVEHEEEPSAEAGYTLWAAGSPVKQPTIAAIPVFTPVLASSRVVAHACGRRRLQGCCLDTSPLPTQLQTVRDCHKLADLTHAAAEAPAETEPLLGLVTQQGVEQASAACSVLGCAGWTPLQIAAAAAQQAPLEIPGEAAADATNEAVLGPLRSNHCWIWMDHYSATAPEQYLAYAEGQRLAYAVFANGRERLCESHKVLSGYNAKYSCKGEVLRRSELGRLSQQAVRAEIRRVLLRPRHAQKQAGWDAVYSLYTGDRSDRPISTHSYRARPRSWSELASICPVRVDMSQSCNESKLQWDYQANVTNSQAEQ
ncbi:MAG: hypothetical protein FRX49_01299 [Trebouxia sp. A1-2]|nr:MAG: hypothetical protein FRX49_01299 [Trebouxia sp. A1-2]